MATMAAPRATVTAVRDTYGSGGGGLWFPYGMTSPGSFHALMARRHMALYGTKRTFGIVADVPRPRRAHRLRSCVARIPWPIIRTRDTSEPVHLFDYCPINDGGVSLVLTSAARARDLAQPPAYLRGCMATALSDSTFPPDDFWRAPTKEAAANSFRMAGLVHDDISTLMIYDNFTPTVLFSLGGWLLRHR